METKSKNRGTRSSRTYLGGTQRLATTRERRMGYSSGCSVCRLNDSPFNQMTMSMLKSTQGAPSSKTRSTLRSFTRQPPQTLISDKKLETDVMWLRRENEEMKNMLHQCEHHLSEAQANIKLLIAERDNFRKLYKQAQEEIVHLQCRESKSMQVHSFLKQVETERDEARLDLHRLASEKENLRERLKITHETAIYERNELERIIEELQNDMLTLEHEREKQGNTHTQMNRTIKGLEREKILLVEKLKESQEEISSLKTECSMFSLKYNHKENELSECQRRLTNKIGELLDMREKTQELDERNDSLVKLVTSLKRDLSVVYGSVSKLENEKEAFQEQLDRKRELLNSVNKELEDKEKIINSMILKIKDHQTAVEALKETVRSREEELDIERIKLSKSEAKLRATMKTKDISLRNCTLAKEKLNKTQQEKKAQLLATEKVKEELKDLETKIKNYETNIGITKEQLTSKGAECREMWKMWQKEAHQAKRWEEQAKQAEATIVNLRTELSAIESEKIDLKVKMLNLKNSLAQAETTEKELRTELSELNDMLEHCEGELDKMQTAHSATLHDLEQSRKLCEKHKADKEPILQELKVCRAEVELLRKQLANEQKFRQQCLPHTSYNPKDTREKHDEEERVFVANHIDQNTYIESHTNEDYSTEPLTSSEPT